MSYYNGLSFDEMEAKISIIHERNDDEIMENTNFFQEMRENNLKEYLQFLVKVINEMNDENAANVSATQLMRFFQPTTQYPKELIENSWFSEDLLDVRQDVRNCVLFGLSNKSQIIRNCCSYAISSLCHLESNGLDVVTLYLEKLINNDDIFSLHGYLRCYYEIFSNGAIQANENTETIMNGIELLSRVLPDTILCCDNEMITMTSLQCAIEFIRSYGSQLYNESCVSMIINNVSILLSQSIKIIIIRLSYDLLFAIVTTYYEISGVFWDDIGRIIDNRSSNNLNMELFCVQAYFWAKLADFEYQLMGDNKSLQYSENNSALLCSLFLDVMTKIDETDMDVEDLNANSPSYYAFVALQSLFRVSPRTVFDHVSSFFSSNVESQKWFLFHAAVLSVAAICNCHQSQEINDFLYYQAIPVLVQASTTNVPRIRETSLYSIYEILNSYNMINDQSFFDEILSIVESNINEGSVLLKRCSSIVLLACKSVPSEIVDINFQRIFQILTSYNSSNKTSEDILLPYHTLYSIVLYLSNTDENRDSLLYILDQAINRIPREPNQDYQIGYIIFLTAIVKKIGPSIQDVSSQVLSVLLPFLSIDRHQMIEETMLAIVYVLENGGIDPIFSDQLIGFLSVVFETPNYRLYILALRILASLFVSSQYHSDSNISFAISILQKSVDSECKVSLFETAPFLMYCIHDLIVNINSSMTIEQMEDLFSVINNVMSFAINSNGKLSFEDICSLLKSVLIAYSAPFKAFDDYIVLQNPMNIACREMETIYIKNFVNDSVLTGAFILVNEIAKTMNKRANTKLYRRNIRRLIEAGLDSTDERISREANIILTKISKL